MRRARQHRCGAEHTFKSHHKIVESILILLIRLGVVLVDVLVYCLLDNFDCTLMVHVVGRSGVSGGRKWSVSRLITSRKLPFDIRRRGRDYGFCG